MKPKQHFTYEELYALRHMSEVAWRDYRREATRYRSFGDEEKATICDNRAEACYKLWQRVEEEMLGDSK